MITKVSIHNGFLLHAAYVIDNKFKRRKREPVGMFINNENLIRNYLYSRVIFNNTSRVRNIVLDNKAESIAQFKNLLSTHDEYVVSNLQKSWALK